MDAVCTVNLAAQAFGEEFKHLRESRCLTRSQFLARFHDVLETIDPDYTIYSEAWLGRLEAGRIAKLGEISRHIIYALCQTLQCTAWERVKLMLLADRSIVTETPQDATDISVLYHCIMLDISNEVCKMLTILISDRRLNELGEAERYEIVLTALKMVIDGRLDVGYK